VNKTLKIRYLSFGILKRFIALSLMLVSPLMIGSVSAEMSIENNKILLGQDYSVFPNDTGSPALCRKKCANDRRCQAWTYVRPYQADGVGECRLKRDIATGFKNGCCISGVKKKDYRAFDEDLSTKRGRLHTAAVERCDRWAEKAIELQQQNVKNRCGYRGRGWHANGERHFRRCMRLSPKDRKAERIGQKNAISSCVEELNFGKRNQCDHYAKMAVLQNTSWAKTGCGQRDKGRWGRDYKKHYSWCLSAEKPAIAKAQKVRENQLQQCFAYEGAKTGPCHEYAEGAIAHFRKNIAKGCDLHGPRWHNNYRRHVGWCRKASPRQRFKEIKKRQRILKTCRLLGKFGIQWR